MPETAWRLARNVHLMAQARVDPQAFGLTPADVVMIRNIAANFVRVAPVNLTTGACLRLLLTADAPSGPGFGGAIWTPPEMLPPMPGNLDSAALPLAQRAVLMRFAVEMNGTPFIPALYRQIAHWPSAIVWLADMLVPLFAAPDTLAAAARFRAEAHAEATTIAARLPGVLAQPAPDMARVAQVLGAIDRCAQTSMEMTLFGRFILDALAG